MAGLDNAAGLLTCMYQAASCRHHMCDTILRRLIAVSMEHLYQYLSHDRRATQQLDECMLCNTGTAIKSQVMMGP